MNGYFRDWIIETMLVWLIVFAIVGFLSFVAWCFAWLWRKAFADPAWPTLQNPSRQRCPKCGSENIELLFGASEDFECFDCGLIYYV